MKVLKKNAGITIVSLIITIVIMLMLAGVSIATIKNTGLFDKTEKATLANIKATSSEQVKLALMSAQTGAAIENKSFNLQYIHDELPKENNKITMYEYTSSAKSVSGVYEYDKKHEYEFIINESGDVTFGEIVEVNKFNISTSNVTSKSVDVTITNTRGIKDAKYTYVAQTSDGKQVTVTDTAKSKTIYGLTAGTNYQVFVLAELSNGKMYKSNIESIQTDGLPDVKLVKGAIDFSGITWNDKKASITISTTTKYTIQYQLNGINGSWINGSTGVGTKTTVNNLTHEDVVYARLTDEVNNTGYTSIQIKDTVKPNVTLAKGTVTTRSITVSASAEDNYKMPDKPIYTFYLNGEEKQSSEKESCTFDRLTSNQEYTIKVSVKDAVGNPGTSETKITTGEMPKDEDVKDLKKGKITFSGITWKDQKASITISTDTNYTIQYQINGINGDWTSASKAGESITVPGLVHNDVVYARLTDGVNNTGYTSTVIKDSIAPTVTLTQKSVSTRAVTVTAGATDNAGMPSSPTYTFYIKKTSDSAYPSSSAQSGTNASFTKDSLLANTSYTIKAETTDSVGNKGSNEINITTGSMPTDSEVKSGKITFSGITWKDKKASITMSTTTSYTIQYQKNSYTGSWTNGTTASGLVHNDIVYARLTDGVNNTGYTSIQIKDSIAPTVTLTQNSISTRAVKVTAGATDNAGMPSSPTYVFSIKEGSGSYTQKQSSSNTSCTIDNLKDNTNYTVKVTVKDAAGNTGTKELPITTGAMPTDSEIKNGMITFTNLSWANQKASININTTSTSYTIQYQVGSTTGTWTSASSAGATVTATGLIHNNTVYARLTDGYNATGYTSIQIKDSIAPTVTVSSAVTTKSVTFTASATDNYSMSSSPTYVFYIDGSSTAAQSGTSKTYTLNNLTAGTKHTAIVKVKDTVGNEGTGSGSGTTSSMPTGAITLATSNGNNWTNQNVTVTATTSKSGFTMQMQIGSGDWQNTSSVTISSNCTVNARLTDGRNYTGTASITESRIDKTAPTISSFTAGTVTTSTIPVTVSASDSGGSGISNYKFYLGSELKATQTTSSYTYEGLTAGTSYTLKVVVTDNAGNSKDSSTTASTQQLGIADAISKGIKVGDTVTYTPPTASYTVAKANSGYTSDQTFNSTNSAMTTWKVWKIDTTNNTIEIVSSTSTATLLYLDGATGYNQGSGIINNICKALYSRSNDITARSLDRIDIEEAMAENWETTRGSDAFNTKIKMYNSSYGSTSSYNSSYGSTCTPSSNYVPNCYTTADIQSAQNNDLRPGSSSATGYTERSGFTCKCTYYNVSSSNMSDAVGSLRATILGTRSSWFASRCVYANSYKAGFYIFGLGSGSFGAGLLFSSNNNSRATSRGLSPLASLGSSVQLQKLDDNIWKVQ